MDKQLEKTVINHYMDMKQLLNSIGHEVAPNGSLYCPFHANHNSKAAHFYENDGGGCIYCFSEHHLYTPYDFYKVLFPEFNVTELAQTLYDNLDEKFKTHIQAQVNVEQELPVLPYTKALKDFKANKITYKELLLEINKYSPKSSDNQYLDDIYNKASIDIDYMEDLDNKYITFMKEKENAYKITMPQSIDRKGIKIPEFLNSYLELSDFHVMLPNIIEGILHNVSFRTLGNRKQFLKAGDNMYLPYNIGNLGDNFKYGTPLLLVEGNIDCDIIREIYPFTIASLTSTLSTNQIQLLSHITDVLIIAYDNDEAGERGYNILRHKLKDFTVHKFNHYHTLKDFGDLIDLKKKDKEEYDYIINSYRTQIETYIK